MKKIITISIFVMLLALTTLSTTVKAVEAVTTEDSAALCSDGIDNDFNTLTDLADPSCASFAPVPAAPVLAENTAALCADGIDNDFNTLVDLADPACASFAPVPAAPALAENTAVLCADGIDNDFNTLTDLADPACAAFAPAPVATTTPSTPAPTLTGGSIGAGSSSGGSSFGGITSGTPISGVFTSGTTGTSTCKMMTTYIKLGAKNNASEVTRLQAFLNTNLGLKISPTGIFGKATFDAVKKFQLKYTDSVLTPWGINYATGYFYKTTQRQMNLLICPAAEIPMPVLN